ncbi:unnamed protein product [Acanthosepion pharaonis]|uniref:Uncharacterized protein n=1 Tax=Acanthosepion pharaonis TaxID=158019 RepID=A0A812BZZ9_ACAPH|nr:unnamed protein product [Sepia pharaonis]
MFSFHMSVIHCSISLCISLFYFPSIPVFSNACIHISFHLSLHLFYFHMPCLFQMSQLSTVSASLHYIFPIILFPSIPVFSNLSTVPASLHYIFPIILSHLSQSFLMYVFHICSFQSICSSSLHLFLFPVLFLMPCSIFYMSSLINLLSTVSAFSLHYIFLFPIILFPSIPLSTVSASLHYIFPIILFPSIPVFSNSTSILFFI